MASGCAWREELAARGRARTSIDRRDRRPSASLGRLAERRFDHLLFLDAVEFGGAPGSVVLLDAAAIAARFPQVSTHKISLGLLARWVEANGTTRPGCWVFSRESLKPASRRLTPAVEATLEALSALLQMRSARRRSIAGQTRSAEVRRMMTPEQAVLDCDPHLRRRSGSDASAVSRNRTLAGWLAFAGHRSHRRS